MPVTTLLRSATMSGESKARREGRDTVQVWFASTAASECQQRLDQGMNPRLASRLAEGKARETTAKTSGREFNRHETKPIN